MLTVHTVCAQVHEQPLFPLHRHILSMFFYSGECVAVLVQVLKRKRFELNRARPDIDLLQC